MEKLIFKEGFLAGLCYTLMCAATLGLSIAFILSILSYAIKKIYFP